MNGLKLSNSVEIQVLVARRKAAPRNGPSGRKPQARVAKTAKTSSAVTPARPTASRWRREASFQVSVTSV